MIIIAFGDKPKSGKDLAARFLTTELRINKPGLSIAKDNFARVPLYISSYQQPDLLILTDVTQQTIYNQLASMPAVLVKIDTPWAKTDTPIEGTWTHVIDNSKDLEYLYQQMKTLSNIIKEGL